MDLLGTLEAVRRGAFFDRAVQVKHSMWLELKEILPDFKRIIRTPSRRTGRSGM
jgi:hypothetical protein